MRNGFKFHLKAFQEAALRLLGKSFGSFMSALVIAITLALPALAYVAIDDLASIAKGVSGKPEISVFFKKDLAEAQTQALLGTVRADPRVTRVLFVAKDDALRQLAAKGGFADVASGLLENPLPDALIIEPADAQPTAVEELRAWLASMREVERVQLDSAWVERLHAIIELGRSTVLMVGGLLGAALIIIIFNTIRLQILTFRHEISVSLLVGATSAYVRRPFLYFGALQGLAGGLLAWALVAGLVHVLSPRILALAQTYSIVVDIHGVRAWHVLALLGFATLLGWLGANLSVQRYLRKSSFSG